MRIQSDITPMPSTVHQNSDLQLGHDLPPKGNSTLLVVMTGGCFYWDQPPWMSLIKLAGHSVRKCGQLTRTRGGHTDIGQNLEATLTDVPEPEADTPFLWILILKSVDIYPSIFRICSRVLLSKIQSCSTAKTIPCKARILATSKMIRICLQRWRGTSFLKGEELNRIECGQQRRMGKWMLGGQPAMSVTAVCGGDLDII